MKKADIIKELIKKRGLAKGEAVELRRFGVFKTKKQKARTIIHPKTGKPIIVRLKR